MAPRKEPTSRERDDDKTDRKSARRKDGPPDLDDLRSKLRFGREDLDDAVISQHQLFDQVSEQVELLISRRDELKYDLELLRAETDKKVRIRLSRDDDKKPTDKAVTAEVDTDPKVIDMTRDLLEASSEARRWSALKGSYDSRGSMLKVAANLFAAGYFTRASVTGARNKIGERDVETVREGRRDVQFERRPRGEDRD